MNTQQPPCKVHSVPCPCVASMEEELKAANWKPTAVHSNSPSWVSPDGKLFPGPGYAWTVLQNRLKQQSEETNL